MASDFGSLREDVPEYVGSILKALESQRDLNEAWTRLFEAYSDEIGSLWKDNAALRDELHAVANRVESLTRARLTEPAEVAEEAVVKRMHEVRLRPRGLGDGAVAECNCGWRSEEMATASAALAHGHYHVQEVTR